MPLVRIDLRKGEDAAYRQEIGRVTPTQVTGRSFGIQTCSCRMRGSSWTNEEGK
jgi:hypothetical protein